MLHVLKKISNSLSTDNSIPIFGYSINEADIASASFFCVVTVLYKAAAFIPLPRCQFCPTFGMPFRKECHVGKYASLLPPSFFIDVVGRTAARARSAQGASQFAAGYTAVRLPHHSCAHHENKLSYSSPVPVDIPGFTGARRPDLHTWPTTERGNNGGPNGEAGAKMKETAPKGTASFYVSAVRRLPCYVINYFLAALAAFLFSFHTYASYIIGVPMKMEA